VYEIVNADLFDFSIIFKGKMQLVFHNQPNPKVQHPKVDHPKCSYLKSIKADTTLCVKSDGTLAAVRPVSNLGPGEPTRHDLGSQGAPSAALPFNVDVRNFDARLKVPLDKFSISDCWSYRTGILFFLKARTPEPSPAKTKQGQYLTKLYFYYVYDDL
jgi:hypothetical protein